MNVFFDPIDRNEHVYFNAYFVYKLKNMDLFKMEEYNITVFPLREKLSNLYFQLLQASSYANNQEYNVFDINDTNNCDSTRCKARIIFSEFDITGYAYSSEPLQQFTHALNSEEYFRDNMNTIRNYVNNLQSEDSNVRTFDNCHCGVRILHKFQVTNRITKMKVYPIGRTCILKFANTNTSRIMKRMNKIIQKRNHNPVVPLKKIWRVKMTTL